MESTESDSYKHLMGKNIRNMHRWLTLVLVTVIYDIMVFSKQLDIFPRNMNGQCPIRKSFQNILLYSTIDEWNQQREATLDNWSPCDLISQKARKICLQLLKTLLIKHLFVEYF
jgi:hypothetical protein